MPTTPSARRPAPLRDQRAAARRRRSPSTPPDREHMGARLRSIRKARGLTLKALSQRSGVPLSTLSKMELGQISVSYEKFGAVAQALAVDIAALFDARAEPAPDTPPPVAVQSRLASAPSYDEGHYQFRMLATDYPQRRMSPVHGTIRARTLDQFPDYIRHAGQEYAMVLSGQVRICFENGQVLDLKRHESAYFDSSVGHVYLSTGRGDAQVLVVMA